MKQRTAILHEKAPLLRQKQVLLGHGSGGKLMHELIEKVFAAHLLPPDMEMLNDSSVFCVGESRLAITTDSYVVDPLFFPGGDIGKLAVNGTINDLAVSGARPLLMAAAFILEEGFAMDDLCRITLSMRAACDQAGISIVTGDTKVVNRGKCDKVFVNTTGIGIVDSAVTISSERAKPGDLVLINGDIAAHGMAILSARQELEFESSIVSDTAALDLLAKDMLSVSSDIHCMRDLTRGGLSSALNEIASCSNVGIRIFEDRIPIQDQVRGWCDVLGFDPLHVANEGKLIAIVMREHAEAVLSSMKSNAQGRQSAIIGEVISEHPGRVIMKTKVGGHRIVDMLSGEQLPRIC
jgi:hydrogenase expression/formation protein HypE